MIVCHCKAISDRTIRQAVREGACSFREVALQSNAGRNCGGCRPAVLDVIEEETAERDRAPASVSRLAAAS
jgi:bacterioferritin-associated ferredoxin